MLTVTADQKSQIMSCLYKNILYSLIYVIKHLYYNNFYHFSVELSKNVDCNSGSENQDYVMPPKIFFYSLIYVINIYITIIFKFFLLNYQKMLTVTVDHYTQRI